MISPITLAIFKREFSAYFATPLAYVFMVIFLMITGIFTFYMGAFYDNGQADLMSFFAFHPWLYLFFIPAVSMRLWSEERKSGTLELLLTLPVSPLAAIVGKYLAALAFIALTLTLTAPMWLTVNYLGDPDNGVILVSYLGSLLMAAAYLAIGSAMSAATKNQVIAFILTVTICFLFTVSGLPVVLDAFSGWSGKEITLAIANISFLTHFDALQKGFVALSDIIFFISMIILWLGITRIIIDSNREAG